MSQEITQRLIIPNDTKMFSQADVTEGITHYLTTDQRCEVIYRMLVASAITRFKILQLSTPYHQAFGVLNLEDK